MTRDFVPTTLRSTTVWQRPIALLVAALLLTYCQPTAAKPHASASPGGSGFAAWQGQQLDELARLDEFDVAVLLIRQGRTILRHASGIADIARGTPDRPGTKFRIGSLTKPFTAAAVMLLLQEGALSLGDSICDFIAACPVAWRVVTIRHLLTHTAGIPDYARYYHVW